MAITAFLDVHVRQSPDAIAAIHDGQQLSFAALGQASTRLAQTLQKSGVGPEVRVGLLVEPSLCMLVGVLAVLEAGGCYVPLDVAYPPARLRYVLDDSQVGILLSQRSLTRSLPSEIVEGRQLLQIDDALAQVERENAGDLARHSDDLNLAYVIYTSGSTGNPKGVMVTRRGLESYLTWAIEHYRIAGGRGAPVTTSFGFDATVTTLLAPLLAGCAVHFPPRPELEHIAELLAEPADYSLIKLTPAHLKALGRLQRIGAIEPTPCLSARVLVIGGERLTGETLAPWARDIGRTRFMNEYGPTEATVGCCIHEVAAGETRSASVPIGHAIPGVTLKVLDPQLEPTPPELSGELYIGGECLARGYLNRSALTAARFLPDAWSGATGARLYRTGDRVREVAQAGLEFMGRLDDQVKIRGHRVELGEIEATIRGLTGVDDVVVKVHVDASRGERLVAYVSFDAAAAEDVQREAWLRRELRSRLPEYMVPTRFIGLDALPLTAHAKIDRIALQLPA